MEIARSSKQGARIFSETCKFFVAHIEAQNFEDSGLKEACSHLLLIGAASLAMAAGDTAMANAIASFGRTAEEKEAAYVAIQAMAKGPGTGAQAKRVTINWPALKRQSIAFLLGAVIAGVFFRYF